MLWIGPYIKFAICLGWSWEAWRLPPITRTYFQLPCWTDAGCRVSIQLLSVPAALDHLKLITLVIFWDKQ